MSFIRLMDWFLIRHMLTQHKNLKIFLFLIWSQPLYGIALSTITFRNGNWETSTSRDYKPRRKTLWIYDDWIVSSKSDSWNHETSAVHYFIDIRWMPLIKNPQFNMKALYDTSWLCFHCGHKTFFWWKFDTHESSSISK